MQTYEITADYRPNNPNKPKYYVHANSKKQAKEKFSRCFTWLTVYDCQEAEEQPDKYCVLD